MIRTFNTIRKIDAVEVQWNKIDAFITQIISADKLNEVAYIMIPESDISENVLNDQFGLLVVLNGSAPSGELYESVKVDGLIPEWIWQESLISDGVIVWKRGENC